MNLSIQQYKNKETGVPFQKRIDDMLDFSAQAHNPYNIQAYSPQKVLEEPVKMNITPMNLKEKC